MEISGVENSVLSEENREDLRPETWQKVRERREIKHFSEDSETGGKFGAEWEAVVKEYLKTGYKETANECDLEVSGIVYKVFRRSKITAFYDASGDTLFDVTNARLAEEYENISVKTNGEEIPVPENSDDIKDTAKKKLKKELNNAKDKSFAGPVIKHLLHRCGEDKGLSEDVVQEHKTWQKCFEYIYSQARKQKEGNCAVVSDEVVYEWAEDYYHKDDKAEEAERSRKAAEEKKKAEERAAKVKANISKSKTEKQVVQKKKKSSVSAEKTEEKKIKRNSRELEGQMDMFSMLGI